MIEIPNRFKFSRFFITVLLLLIAFIFYIPVNVPTFASDGFLGYYNISIVIILIVLASRQFFYLFFSVCEEIRRDLIPLDFKNHPISVIVPAYNEAVVIAQTIEHLKKLNYPQFEVIIVDDESKDGTYEQAIKAVGQDPRFRVLRKANGGKAAALNFGIKHSQYGYIFCMDADSEIDPNALRFGVRHFRDADVAAVAGSVLVSNRKNVLTQFQAAEYLNGLNFVKSGQSFLGLVTIIPGPSGLFKKSAVAEVGYYDSDTFAEDCDLTFKLTNAGGKVVYEPYMEVKTEIPADLVSLIKQRYRWNRGILQVLKKHFQSGYRQILAPHKLILVSYMVLETLLLPVLNVFITLGALGYQFFMWDFSIFSLWLFVLIFLDLAVLTVTLVDARWPLSLFFYTLLNRFTYAFFNDVVRILSTIEELLGIQMSWSKLERIGTK